MTHTPQTVAVRRRGESAADRRRGMALVLVLALISLALGVSYSLVRVQTATVKTATNGRLSDAARQAAYTGLSAGLRRISQTSWGGIGSTVTGKVNATDTYGVTFAAGDTQLTTTAAAAADWPYRMTVTATGYAVDPTASGVTTTYRVEAVAQLVPKQLASNPAMWNTMLGYVFYQTDNAKLYVEIPLKIDGPQRWNGELKEFLKEYPTTHSQRQRYLSDLNAMRTNGYADCRPFTGPIVTLTSALSSTNRNYLTSSLGITLSNATVASTTNWSHPGTVTSYRLYPGGPSYDVPTLGSTISGTTLQADPRTNPAGLFYRNGDLTLGNNTTVVGTLIASGKVTMTGANVSLQPHSLSALTGTTASPQLPAVVAGADVRVAAGCDVAVRGVVASFGDFVSLGGSSDARLDFQGNLIARGLEVQKRNDWDLGSFWWSWLWSWFNSQSGSPTIEYFPVYCQAAAGMNYTPALTIAGPSGSAIRQWFTNGTSVYAVGSGDAGLVWSVLRITDLH